MSKKKIEIQVYDFKIILRYSIYAALISLLIMLFSYILSKYIHPLWFAIFVVGVPYSYFMNEMKKNIKTIIFTENEILFDTQAINLNTISSYRIFNALRLYFGLRFNLNTTNKYIYYVPVEYKESLSIYLKKNGIKETAFSSDFLIKHYLLLYLFIYFALLVLIYYVSFNLYYFFK